MSFIRLRSELYIMFLESLSNGLYLVPSAFKLQYMFQYDYLSFDQLRVICNNRLAYRHRLSRGLFFVLHFYLFRWRITLWALALGKRDFAQWCKREQGHAWERDTVFVDCISCTVDYKRSCSMLIIVLQVYVDGLIATD